MFLLYPRSLPRPRSTSKIQLLNKNKKKIFFFHLKTPCFLITFRSTFSNRGFRRSPQFDDVALLLFKIIIKLAGYRLTLEPPKRPTFSHLISG